MSLPHHLNIRPLSSSLLFSPLPPPWSAQALPEPNKKVTLPAGKLTFPFSFPLRGDLPATAELGMKDASHIRYVTSHHATLHYTLRYITRHSIIVHYTTLY